MAGEPEPMRIIAIDEDRASLEHIEALIRKTEGTEFLKGFTDPVEGIAYIEDHSVDLVFMAVAMSSMQGILAAQQIEKINPAVALAFVTREREYSYEAWRTNAVHYILKPIEAKDLERAILRARYYKVFVEMMAATDITIKDVFIKCFPSFDVFVKGEIVDFTYAKVKELFAFLVYQQGNWCTIDQIVFSILEDQEEKSGKQYYRTLMYRLKKVLGKYGIEYILETGYGRARMNPLYCRCEYYEYLRGGGKTEFVPGVLHGNIRMGGGSHGLYDPGKSKGYEKVKKIKMHDIFLTISNGCVTVPGV